MSEFTHQQQHELTRAEKLIHFLRNNQAKVDTYLPLKQRQTQLELHVSNLQKSAGGKLGNTTSITAEKKKTKKDLGLFYESLCGVSQEYLLSKNNLEMAANFKVTKRTITHLKDGEVAALTKQINKWIETELIPQPDFAPYGITAATLAEGLALINRYAHFIGLVPGIKAGKSAIIKDMVTQTEQIRRDVESIEMLMGHFRTSHHDFFNGFNVIKYLINTGIRHNIIKGKVTLGGKPLPDARITCNRSPKETTTDHLGQFIFPRMRAGLTQFICAPPGMPAQDKAVTVLRGRLTEVDWEF